MSIQACRMSVLSRYCGYDSFLRSDYISSVKIVVHIVNTVQTAGLFTGKPVGEFFMIAGVRRPVCGCLFTKPKLRYEWEEK